MRNQRQLAVAFHEAGHAVIAQREGWRSGPVTIEPADGYAGRTTTREPRWRFIRDVVTPAAKERLFQRARVCLAGYAAQRKAAPNSKAPFHVGTGDDRHDALLAVENLLDGSGTPRVVEAYRRALEIETEAMLDRAWPAVEALAAALLERKTVSGEEADEIIRRAMSRGVK